MLPSLRETIELATPLDQELNPRRSSGDQSKSEKSMLNVFKGRIGRGRYWNLTGLCALALVVALCSVVMTANQTSASPVNVPATVVAIAGALLFFATCVALLGIGVWRLHDRGKSGFWIILYYAVPFVMALLAIDPEGRGMALNYIALAISVWAMIDLGILKGRPLPVTA
jgi:uncharacterized membrane protein YhaH (DUF805 family)